MTRSMKIFFVISALLIPSVVYAFGGGGHGRTERFYERHTTGVDGVGVHRHIDGHEGDFCLVDLSHDPYAVETQSGVYECKAGAWLDCSAGKCAVCSAGTYSGPGSENCVTAPAGSYAPEGASAPVPCPLGTYSSDEGASECTVAEPGYYVDEEGQTEPKQCQPGEYTSVPGAALPTKAEPGYYVAGYGATSSIPANPGYYVDTEGATEQTPCPAGTYSDQLASVMCVTPEPGYQPDAPVPDAEVPCTDTTTPGACGCEGTHLADGMGGCVCPVGWIEKEDESCVNLCANFEPTLCHSECDPETGNALLDAEGTACGTQAGYGCDVNGACIWFSPCWDDTDTEKKFKSSTDGLCYACSTMNNIKTTQEEVTWCGNRFLDNLDYSQNCDLTSGVTASRTQCESCGTRWIASQDNKCYACSSDTALTTTAELCAACNNTENPRFLGANGKCYSCHRVYAETSTATECAQCPDRYFNAADNKCYPACGENQYRSTDGKCWSCDEDAAHVTTADMCGVCSERFIGSDNKCYRCDTTTSVSVSGAESCTCANRVYYNGACRLSISAEPYSNCQTAEIVDGKLVRGFKAVGTSCVQSGINGICNGWGQCVPQNAMSCSANSNCPSGYFCHTGGTYSTTRDGVVIGKTPNVCEKVQPLTFTYEGKTYYYNSKEDLISWCRPADGNKNCIWGYLAKSGAQNWCEALGKRLLSYSEFNDLKSVLVPKLPYTRLSAHRYWTSDGLWSDGSIDTGRSDGYESKGGVICVGDAEPESDITDCTGKADGTVCSTVDSSLLENPSRQLPVCISGNCECPYEGDSYDVGEGVCLLAPDGWGEANCNKLTEKEVACSVGGDGEFIQRACVSKNSSFNGAVVDESQQGCAWTCSEDRDVQTGCCLNISAICVTPPFPDDEYYTYTDAANVVHNVSKCYAQSEDITEWMSGVEPYVLIPTNEKGEWTTKCVTAHVVDKYSGYGSGTLMLLADQHAVGFCPDELVQTHGGCIDPAAVNVVVQF